ncbi:MAG: stage II sporulation protein R [Oscillospiraceae bacterium]|nr:stage II sporulation protein R [Oscillospiraceae bacterium]
MEGYKNQKNIRLLRWEISLIIGIAAALIFGAAGAGTQAKLQESLIRLHVVAGSNSRHDQELKLKVRDKALDLLKEPLSGVSDARSAELAIRGNLPFLQKSLEEFLNSEGLDLSVALELSMQKFPTKDYGSFALPAGEYNSLRVILGEGQGENWWCVVFPPLCAAGTMEELQDSSYAAGLTEEELGLITRENEGYVIKFKLLEWIGRLQNRL